MMMTHEVRGDTTPLALAVPPPRSEEGGGEDLAQLSPPLTYDFGLDVHGFHC